MATAGTPLVTDNESLCPGLIETLNPILSRVTVQICRFVWLGILVANLLLAIIGGAIVGSIYAWIPIIGQITPIIITLVTVLCAHHIKAMYIVYWVFQSIAIIVFIISMVLLKNALELLNSIPSGIPPSPGIPPPPDFSGLLGGFIALMVISVIVALFGIFASVLLYFKRFYG